MDIFYTHHAEPDYVDAALITIFQVNDQCSSPVPIFIGSTCYCKFHVFQSGLISVTSFISICQIVLKLLFMCFLKNLSMKFSHVILSIFAVTHIT